VPYRRNVLRRSPVVAATLATLLAGCQFDALTRAESERLDAFDFYWQQLADDYPLFGKQQVNWNELRQRYRGAVPFARAPHEFYHLLTGMLSELGDPHVSLAVPHKRLVVDGRKPTSLLDVADLRLMPIEGRIHVVQWPAAQEPPRPEGLPTSACPELWRVEGFPVVLSLVGNLLLGPPDSPVELQLRWRNGVITRHVMARPAAGTRRQNNAFGHLDAGGMTWQKRAHGPFPWLAIHTLDDELDIAQIDQVIDQSHEGEAMVLDLRANLGGRWLRAQQLVERFLREPIELVLVPSHPTSTWFGLFDLELFVRSEWQPRPPIFDHPVVVVTSALTGSAAEHAARVLQRYAGAKVVGERTAGAEAAIQQAIGPDGGVLRFGSTRVVDRTGVGLQSDGVVPDFSVRLTLDDLERLGPDDAVSDWERRLRAATVQAVRSPR
jgi:C-terminal processing protease CtpA/Prc